MEKTVEILTKSSLFKNFTKEEIALFLKDKNTHLKTIEKNNIIASEGTRCDGIGIVLEGTIQITKESASGNQSILRQLHKGDIFGEMAVFSSKKRWPATVYAKTKGELLFINFSAFFAEGQPMTQLREKLIYNLLSILSNRALYLNSRLSYLFLKTIREKIALYLLEEYHKNNTLLFLASMNRNTLADFLNVTRPSLSRELSQMREEGIIDYSGSSFKILNLKKLESLLE